MAAATSPPQSGSIDPYNNYPTMNNPYGFNNPFASINPGTNEAFDKQLAQYSGPNAQDEALSAAAGALTPAQQQQFDQNFAENNKTGVGFWGDFNEVAPYAILAAAGYGAGDAIAGGVGAGAGAAGAADAGAGAGAATAGGTDFLAGVAPIASDIDLGAAADAGIASGIGGGAAGGAGLAAGASQMLDPINVTAASTAGVGASDAAPLIASGGFDASGEPLLASNTFLPATGSGNVGDTAQLTPDLAAQFGVSDLSDIGEPGAFSGGGFDFASGSGGIPTDFGADGSAFSTGIDDGSTPTLGGGGSALDGVENWFKNPKNLLTAGGLGISALSAFSKPKLPGASQTALNTASQGVGTANSVIQSGGKATGEWSSQKASIDATINQQIQQASESIMQAAQNSGMGNQNSAVVQQQIQQMKQNAEVARQQLYTQAQQQNVSNAMQLLSSDNQILMAIGNQQLALSQEARQSAAQTASLALQLAKLFF